jgi:CxxH/CxxC protein (TIGR04129 family)
MQFVCKEHVDLALDIIVDDYEKAPELLTLEQAGLAEEQPLRTCTHCDEHAVYVVS